MSRRCWFLPAGRGWTASGCSRDNNGGYLWKAESQRVNHGAVRGSAAAAALTGADDAFGLAQQVPVRGHAEVTGALDTKKTCVRVWITAAKTGFILGDTMLTKREETLPASMKQLACCLSRLGAQKQLCPSPELRTSAAELKPPS